MDILHLSQKEINELRGSIDFYDAINYAWMTYNLRRPDLLFKNEDGNKKDVYQFVSEFDVKDGDISGAEPG